MESTFVQAGLLPTGTTAERPNFDDPTEEGWFRYNTDDHLIEFYNGTEWIQGGGGSGSGMVFVQNTTPVGADANSFWWNIDTGRLYILYHAPGANTQWVETTPSNLLNQANSTLLLANNAFNTANEAYLLANSAYNYANTLGALSNVVPAFNKANSAYTLANNAYIFANTLPATIATAYTQANIAYNTANTAITDANQAGTNANNAYGQANTATSEASIARGKANTACTQSDQAGTQANNAYAFANTLPATIATVYAQANTAYNTANTAITDANQAGTQANLAYGKANTACTQSDAAGTQANAAYALANLSSRLAYATVNTLANNVTAGSNNSTLVIRGGNNIIITANTGNGVLMIADDTRNEIAAFTQANSAYTLANNAYIFANTLNVTLDGIVVTDLPTLYNGFNVLYYYQNIIIDAMSNFIWPQLNTTSTTANSGSNTANTALTNSQGAFDKANGAAQLSFVTITANGTNLVADSNNDTLTVLSSSNVSVVGNATGDNVVFDLVSTAVTAGVYGGAANNVTFSVDGKGRLVSAANAASIIIRRHSGDAAGVNTAAQSQNWFPTLGNVTVTAGTLYHVEGVLSLVDTAKTHTQSISIEGTATVNSFDLQIFHNDIANNVTSISSSAGSAIARLNWTGPESQAMSTGLVLNATSTVGQHVTYFVGYINISGGGTLLPRFSISAVGAPVAPYTGPTIKRGSYFSLIPITANTANAIGAWA